MISRPANSIAFVTLLFLAPAASSAAHLSTSSYRESADSFTWELQWDGSAGLAEELQPQRAGEDEPELWTPSVRLSGGRQGFRCVFRGRHTSRAHELDAPEGPAVHLVFRLRQNLKGPAEWARIGAAEGLHLQTSKDHKDQYEVLAQTRTDAGGDKTYRLVFQASHGPPPRAKKPKKGKGPGKGKRKEGG